MQSRLEKREVLSIATRGGYQGQCRRENYRPIDLETRTSTFYIIMEGVNKIELPFNQQFDQLTIVATDGPLCVSQVPEGVSEYQRREG